MPLLSPDGLAFVTARGLASLTTLRADGSPHVTPVGYTWDQDTRDTRDTGLVRVICSGSSRKAVHARRNPRVAVCAVDGARWLTFEGRAEVSADPDRVADAVARYTARYRPPRVNPERVVIEMVVDRLLGSAALRA